MRLATSTSAAAAAATSSSATNEQEAAVLQCATQLQHLQQPQQVYFFANIDNKSSVISLSKLLVREKAAEEAEPRVYLIASSPRQPEMYELAFMSRRHQVNFVDKLKSCIELRLAVKQDKVRRREQVSASRRRASLAAASMLMLRSRHKGGDKSAAATRSTCSSSNCSINADELDLSADCPPRSDQCDSGETYDSYDDELDDDDGLDDARSSACECASSNEQLKHLSLDNFDQLKLDIEQDVVQPPSHEHDDSCAQEEEEPTAAANCSPKTTSTTTAESGLSERARDSCDESNLVGNKQKTRAFNRRRRANRPRRPLDYPNVDLSTTSSSSSSNASELAHRRAIELAAAALNQQVDGATGRPPTGGGGANEEVDSGRGQDSTSSSASSSGSSASTSTRRPPPTDGASAGGDKRPPAEATGGGPAQQSPHTSTSCASKCTKLTTCSTQRKLSSVSTISFGSKLQLIGRRRSSQLVGSSGGADLLDNKVLCARCAAGDDDDATSGYAGGTWSRLARANGAESPSGRRLIQMRRRSSQFVPEQKLEELRDLRIQLDKDKSEWQEKFNRMQEQLLNERRELDLAREQLRHERSQVANEREQLYRKLDVLKEKGILLSPSHKVIITSPPEAFRLAAPAPSKQQVCGGAGGGQVYGGGGGAYNSTVIQVNDQSARAQLVQQANRVPVHLSQQQQQLFAGRVPQFIGSASSFLAERFGAAPPAQQLSQVEPHCIL